MEQDLVTIDIKDGVADVRLNRTEKYNALSPDMFQAIIDAGESLAVSYTHLTLPTSDLV